MGTYHRCKLCFDSHQLRRRIDRCLTAEYRIHTVEEASGVIQSDYGVLKIRSRRIVGNYIYFLVVLFYGCQNGRFVIIYPYFLKRWNTERSIPLLEKRIFPIVT